MIAHARRSAPRECCGVLLGEGDRIVAAVPAANVTSEPSRFEIDPLDLLRIECAARRAGQRIVGYYHSHPGGDLAPSAIDRAEPLWPDLAPHLHGIVSPAGGFAAYETRGGQWSLVRHQTVNADP